MITGDEIVQARGRMNWTQQQLAEAVGVSRDAVVKWESGGQIRRANLARLMDVLGLTAGGTQRKSDDMELLELMAELNRVITRRVAGDSTAADRAEEAALQRALAAKQQEQAQREPGAAPLTGGDPRSLIAHLLAHPEDDRELSTRLSDAVAQVGDSSSRAKRHVAQIRHTRSVELQRALDALPAVSREAK